jgi:hypothetical protein
MTMKFQLAISLFLTLAGAGISSSAVAEIATPLESFKPISFQLDVQPILTRLGCNAGDCHGKARGQNGFALSLLAFDPQFDHASITKNARGRRIFSAAPDRSLLLLKAAGVLPHGGGQRMKVGDANYNILQNWIAQGAPQTVEGEPKLDRVTVSPKLGSMKAAQKQPLVVTAHYTDGSKRDVTPLAAYLSSEEAVATVDEHGIVKAGTIPGETVIMARYMYKIDTFAAAVPMPGKVDASVYAKLPRANFIDEQVFAKLQTLGIVPSKPIDDAKFLRRVHLDLIGRIPTADETRAFLTDKSKDKRSQLVDALLARPEYPDFWANKWADLLRPNPYHVGIKSVRAYDQWIRNAYRKNQPYDQFVRALITARGSTWHNGAAVMFRDRRTPDEIATLVSQLFLGIRLECAKCHHHPFEKWSQSDYYSFAAFFSELRHKGTGISAPISGSEEVIYTGKVRPVLHPLTNQPIEPRSLYGDQKIKVTPGKYRDALADWITSSQNDYFAMVAANRIWANLMGRGVVEPVDDLRVTNPASNEPLLRSLGTYFRKVKFDNKKLLRAIVLSNVYALSSIPNNRNLADTRYYSRHYRQRLRGEVLLDAVSDITQIPESFAAMPKGSRAIQLWTTRITSLTLDTFARPDPNQSPPCQRMEDPTVTQALHMMMAPHLHAKVISDKGLPAKLASKKLSTDKIIERLYLSVYNRFPLAKERVFTRSVFAEKDMTPRQATQDLLWAMLNTPEFLFKD